MAEVEDLAVAEATPTTTTNTESEGATTDEDVHLSPTCVYRDGSERIKLRCSFGGRFIPRRNDGVLKYVGGETRVLAVPRNIPFRELKKKVEETFKTEVAAIKYQLLSLSEDLDVLISVTCDDDLAHMLDEYDRFEMKRSPTTSPRFRIYVFAPQTATSPRAVPAASIAPVSSSRYNASGFSRQHHHYHQHHHRHHGQAEERYVATVPGTPSGGSPPPYPSHGTVSAGNSPPRAWQSGMGMQRVRSSPNLSSLMDATSQHQHPQHAGDIGGGGGYSSVSSSPGHAVAGQLDHHYLQHYAPHVPSYPAGPYVHRVGNYLVPPMVPVSRSPDRPYSRGGPLPHGGEMQTPKKALVWD